MNVSEKEERKEDADKKRPFMLDVMFLNTFGLFRGHNKSQTQKNLIFVRQEKFQQLISVVII